MDLTKMLFIVFALSIDTFTASFSYSINKIKLSFKIALIINLICTGLFFLSLTFGRICNIYFNTDIICFIILFILGITKLFDSFVKKLIKKFAKITKEVKFKLFHFNIILNIYSDAKIADLNSSKNISLKESLFLSLALSLDSIFSGIGLGFTINNIFLISILLFIVGFISLILGKYLADKLSKNVNLDLSWIGGIILIVIAFLKI